jgi:hypothetical protein
MPKLSEGTIAIGALIFFAFWILIGLPFLYYPSPVAQQHHNHQAPPSAKNSDHSNNIAGAHPSGEPQSTPNPESTTHPSAEAKEERGEFWSAKLTDWLLAAFTFALVIFTGLLYHATAGLFTETAGLRQAAAEQSADMKASIAAAQKSADAASRNAKTAELALLSVEIPYLYPFVRSHGIRVGTSQKTGQLAVVGFDYGNEFMRIYFKNFGRTPAEIIEVNTLIRMNMGMPPAFVHPERPFNPLFGSVVTSGGDSEEFPVALTEGQYQTVYRREFDPDMHIFWLLGYVRYTDVFENEYVRGFTLGFAPNTETFYPMGGEGYNYRKKTKTAGVATE